MKKHKYQKKLNNEIISTIAQNLCQLTYSDLLQRLKPQKKTNFNYHIAYLLADKIIDLDHNNRFYVVDLDHPAQTKFDYVIGKVKITKKLVCIVKSITDKNINVYVEKKDLYNGINKDMVIVKAYDQKPVNDKGKRLTFAKKGEVLFVIERKNKVFTALFRGLDSYSKEPIFTGYMSNNHHKIIAYTNHYSTPLVKNNLYLLEIIKNDSDFLECEVVFDISAAYPKKVLDLLAIAYNKQIKVRFSDETLQEVDNIDAAFDAKQEIQRHDLQHLPFVTIDPVNAKDMDDAIYVIAQKNGYKLYVAIADVTHYVRLNTALWQDVLKKGSSVYMLDLVLPMLPSKLSEDLCSLLPNQKRYAMVCEIDFDNKGNYVDQKVYLGIIQSHQKFAYEEINAFFSEQKPLKTTAAIEQMLKDADALAQLLCAKMEANGYLSFSSKKVEIQTDDNGQPTDIIIHQTQKAEAMIEAFMVAANETICHLFTNAQMQTPFVFRIHDAPEAAKIRFFCLEAQKLGFDTSSLNTNKLTNQSLSAWFKQQKDHSNFALLEQIMLKTMAKAKYDIHNMGHFGLGLSHYTHFTSPIRRLADVLVHMLLRAFVLNDPFYDDKKQRYLVDNLERFCGIANYTEIDASYCEWDANGFKFAQYLSQRIGQVYAGVVNHISEFGFYVVLPNTIDGFVPLKLCPFDYFLYQASDNTLVGKNTKRVISLGTQVEVRVEKAEPLNNLIEFALVKIL